MRFDDVESYKLDTSEGGLEVEERDGRSRGREGVTSKVVNRCLCGRHVALIVNWGNGMYARHNVGQSYMVQAP